jgi:nucleoside-diphosphate-sugar epimerase
MVLVTGGSGLLGGYLLRELLRAGEKVKALYRSRFPTLLTENEIRSIDWIKGDIFDVVLLKIMQRCNEVYHCAGLVSFNPSQR